jgi:4-amino-4-deoxy-L-arabinose transferase-like glycosyltransferase
MGQTWGGAASAPARATKKDGETASPGSEISRNAWYRSATLWLVVAALALRIAFMLVLGTYRFDRHDDQSDVNEDTYIARSLTEGHGFSSPFSNTYSGPTAWVTPVYPYFVAAVFKHFGVMSHRSYFVIETVQSLFSALTVLPLLGVGVLVGSRRSGIAAAVLWAFFPWFSRWALTWIWETSLSALLLACLIWYALWLREHASPRAWIGFGALWGFTLLVNPALASLLPVTLAFALYGQWRRGLTWIRPAITVAAMCFLVVSPWLVRNRVVMGQWVFLRDNFGFEFALGNYHLSFGRGWAGKHPAVNPREFARYQALGELGYIQANTAEALQFVRQYPGEFVTLCAKRVMYFWDGSAMQYRGPVATYWLPWSFALFSFLLLVALLICLRLKMKSVGMLLAVVLIYPLPYYLTHPPIRYRHMIEPEMVLLIAFAAMEGVAWFRARRDSPSGAASA